MSKHSEYLMTLAALDLVEQEGYKIIDVRIIGKEIWLNHPSNTRELIRFSLNGGFVMPRQEERTAAIRKAIEKIFGERTLMYDVRFDEDESYYEIKEDTVFVVLSPKTNENVFLDRFPKLRSILQAMEEKPESLEEAQKRLNLQRPKQAAPNRPKLPKVSLIIMILCVVMFGGQVLLTSAGGYGFIDSSILLGAYYKTFIVANYEYWRFLTSGFLHMDFVHLMMNMYSLYNLGIFFENKFGQKRLVLTLLIGIIGGSMFLFVSSGNVFGVGLSGGLFALLGSIVVHLIESGQIQYRPVQMQLFQLFIINLFISLIPGIAVMAHVGGFVSGVLVALYFSYKPSWKALKPHVMVSSFALLAILVVLIGIDKKHQPYFPVTDQAVVKMARELGLGWYADTLDQNLTQYYQKEPQ
jgi:rhomboid protease GluP